jgi:hypothetical protein
MNKKTCKGCKYSDPDGTRCYYVGQCMNREGYEPAASLSIDGAENARLREQIRIAEGNVRVLTDRNGELQVWLGNARNERDALTAWRGRAEMVTQHALARECERDTWKARAEKVEAELLQWKGNYRHNYRVTHLTDRIAALEEALQMALNRYPLVRAMHAAICRVLRDEP